MPEAFDPYRKWLGIPPKDQPPNHYRLLAIERFEDDPDVIEAAADARMAHVRTYQTGQNSSVSQRILNELAQARLCLLDPVKKRAYDAELSRGQAAPSGASGVAHPASARTANPPASSSLPIASPLPVAAETPLPQVQAHAPSASGRRRSSRPAWLVPATVAAGALLLVGGVALIVRLAGKSPNAPSMTNAAGNQARTRSRGRRGAKQANSVSSDSPLADLSHWAALAADADHRPTPPGVVADRIVIWNQHNDYHHDRGTRECILKLLREGKEVWRKDQIALPWSADRDEKVSVAVPKLRFDRVRVEVTQWEQTGGGLAEIEVYLGDSNLARGCPAIACAHFNSSFTAEKLTDGVTTSYFDGYWLLPDRTPGWAEIDLSFAEPRASAGVEAEKLVLWNTHNSRHNDRGAVAVNLQLSLGPKEVWRQDDVTISWLPDQDTSLEVALPRLPFDRVRVEITRWPALGGGLSEVQVMQGESNLARACPVRSSGCLNHRFRADNVVDGITSSIAEELGYWCTPDRSGGWIEIDLSCNDPRVGDANRQLGAYRAIVEHDWPRALPWLAKSPSRELRKLALLDANSPGDPNELKVIGDGWWDGAEASRGAGRLALRERAAFRYAQAMMRLGESECMRPLERIAASRPLSEGTYLFLLPETELKGVGYLREPIVLLGGIPRPWGLWMHPHANQPTMAAFALGKKYRRFAGAAAVNDTAQQGPQTPLTFRVVGNGRALWSSQPLRQTGAMEAFDVDVSGVDRLELAVDCPGSEGFCHAVWVDPILDPSPDWPGISIPTGTQPLAAAQPAVDIPEAGHAPTMPAPPEESPSVSADEKKPPSLSDLLRPGAKLPPPDEAIQKAAEQTLKQRYKTDWLGKGNLGRMGAARLFAAAASKKGVDPAEQFMLLNQASELAAATGQYSEAATFIEQLAERFEISPFALRVDALMRVNRAQRLAAEKQAVVDDALQLVADALSADDYAAAERAAKLAGLAARGGDDPSRAEAAKQCLKEVTTISRQYEAVRPALERLASAPDDAEASFKAGQFECLVKHDWQGGLSRLARGSDEPLRRLAQQDLLTPADAPAQLALAQSWLDQADQSKDDVRRGCQLRALEWLERARVGCRGPERERAEQQIAEIRASAAFKARPMRWLEQLRLGVEMDEEVDCAIVARKFELNKTFDIGRSWFLSLEFMPRDLTAPGQVFFIGDERGGRDPLFVSVLDDGRLYIGISDSHDPSRTYGLYCTLNKKDIDQWKSVRVRYDSHDSSVNVDLDGQLAAEGILPFVPAIDRPMPCWIGGVSPTDQRFKGKVRRVLLSN